MKPFDIELAKAGHPVCTREGEPVRIVCYDRNNTKYPIMALIDKGEYENYCSYTIEGKFSNNQEEIGNDLFMSPVKKEGWINLYKKDGVTRTESVNIYQSMEDAMAMHTPNNYITTVKIEWEE
ncbi:MAG: hypothetical protein KHW86_17270 [Porphyromonadaceae bacterium]|nr:hypothetical protein [Porphyromonadaceae bacterium]